MKVYLVEECSSGKHTVYARYDDARKALVELVNKTYISAFNNENAWKDLDTKETREKAKKILGQYINSISTIDTEPYVNDIGYIETIGVIE